MKMALLLSTCAEGEYTVYIARAPTAVAHILFSLFLTKTVLLLDT